MPIAGVVAETEQKALVLGPQRLPPAHLLQRLADLAEVPVSAGPHVLQRDLHLVRGRRHLRGKLEQARVVEQVDPVRAAAIRVGGRCPVLLQSEVLPGLRRASHVRVDRRAMHEQPLPLFDGVIHVRLVRAHAHGVEQPLGIPGGHVQATFQGKLRRERHIDREQIIRPLQALGPLGQGRLDPAHQLGKQRRAGRAFAGRKEERRAHGVELDAVDLWVEVGEFHDTIEKMPAHHLRPIVQAAAVVSVGRAEGQLGMLLPERAGVGIVHRGEMGVVHAEAGQGLLAQVPKVREHRPEVPARLGGEIGDVLVHARPPQITAGPQRAVVHADPRGIERRPRHIAHTVSHRAHPWPAVAFEVASQFRLAQIVVQIQEHVAIVVEHQLAGGAALASRQCRLPDRGILLSTGETPVPRAASRECRGARGRSLQEPPPTQGIRHSSGPPIRCLPDGLDWRSPFESLAPS